MSTQEKPTAIAILSTTSTPQGVGCKVLVQSSAGPIEIDTMVVQTEAGFQMNWRTTTPWMGWIEPFDATFNLSKVIEQVEPIVMGVAGKIWETLPTYNQTEKSE
jgi:hypothetical protein